MVNFNAIIRKAPANSIDKEKCKLFAQRIVAVCKEMNITLEEFVASYMAIYKLIKK